MGKFQILVSFNALAHPSPKCLGGQTGVYRARRCGRLEMEKGEECTGEGVKS
jgi:hypothetical protein